MKPLVIVIIILVILVGGIFTLLYFLYEKPMQDGDTQQYINVSIKMFDGNTQVVTGFDISLDNTLTSIASGNTVGEGYVRVQIPANHTYYIFNRNLGNQTFYTARFIGRNYGTPDNVRAEIVLDHFGNLTAIQDGKLGIDNPVYLNLESKGLVRSLLVCMRWTAKFVTVNINQNDATRISDDKIPSRLKNQVDRCYETHKSLDSTSMKLRIDYVKYGDILPEDTIKFYAIDGDIRYYSINPADGLKSYVYEDKEGKDVGLSDLITIFK